MFHVKHYFSIAFNQYVIDLQNDIRRSESRRKATARHQREFNTIFIYDKAKYYARTYYYNHQLNMIQNKYDLPRTNIHYYAVADIVVLIDLIIHPCNHRI